MGVACFDQLDLPCAAPFPHLLFTRDCRIHICVELVVDKGVDREVLVRLTGWAHIVGRGGVSGRFDKRLVPPSAFAIWVAKPWMGIGAGFEVF